GLIDSHAHLTDENLIGAIDEVLGRARAGGVERIITVAQSVADAERAIELARGRDEVSATAGIHPHEAGAVRDDDWRKLEALLAEPEVVACGEIGLDYHYEFADRSLQQAVLVRQLALAGDADLPLIIHCREAFDDTIRLLTESSYSGRPVVFHCFGGRAEDAERLGEQGWRLSFTGSVTYKSARGAQDVARAYPADRLMIETDSPYLSPTPLRGRFPNEPAHLMHTARFLADLRNEPLEELIAQTAANTRDFFGLRSEGG
ncbi:MAG TPA: TatD family hydrolase, partial [Phycisphaerae bacterium]|nr:TatD family hydrolase [Phycisphaerae bacterium]